MFILPKIIGPNTNFAELPITEFFSNCCWCMTNENNNKWQKIIGNNFMSLLRPRLDRLDSRPGADLKVMEG